MMEDDSKYDSDASSGLESLSEISYGTLTDSDDERLENHVILASSGHSNSSSSNGVIANHFISNAKQKRKTSKTASSSSSSTSQVKRPKVTASTQFAWLKDTVFHTCCPTFLDALGESEFDDMPLLIGTRQGMQQVF